MKTVQLDDTDHALLKRLADVEGRSMPKQIKIMTIQAWNGAHPLRSFDTKSPKERMAEMKPEDVPESWLPAEDLGKTGIPPYKLKHSGGFMKPQASFNDKPKPHPKGKSK